MSSKYKVGDEILNILQESVISSLSGFEVKDEQVIELDIVKENVITI